MKIGKKDFKNKYNNRKYGKTDYTRLKFFFKEKSRGRVTKAITRKTEFE